METNQLIIWITILLSIIFFLALLKIKPNTNSKNILIVFVLNFSLHFASIYITEYSSTVSLNNLNAFFSANYGPLLLLYVLSFKKGFKIFRQYRFTYFIPSMIFLILGTFYLSKFSEILIMTAAILICNFIFLGAAITNYLKMRIHLPIAKQKWILSILIIFIVLLVVAAFHLVFAASSLYNYHSFTTTLILIIAAVLVCFFIYFSLTTPQLFQGISKKYDSGLSAEESLKLANKIELFLKNEERFLDDTITLNTIAKRLNTRPKNVSQALNQHLGNNFYDVLNSYRLEKVEHILKNEPEVPIKNVMYDCGFTNKATFNKVFKQKHQITPSEFRKINLTN